MNQEIQPVFEHVMHLHPNDPVAIAKHELQPGLALALPDGGMVVVRTAVPAGHKLALSDLQTDQEVLRYGQPIGRATGYIPAGSWVHTHNLAVGEIARQYSYKVVEPAPIQPSGRTFSGYRRSHGGAGTRNYIAIISTVNCSAHVASQIARAFTPERLAGYANVDGVIPIVHHTGCGMPLGGLSYTYLKRMLANLAFHPNIGAAVYVGLGCEVNQLADCQPLYSSAEMEQLGPQGLVIQDQGGFRKTVAAGIEAIEELLPRVNAVKRTPQPLADLAVALQCGGSDGWSGVTANPLVGYVADSLVLEGGTVALAETPEIIGAEQLLTQRATSAEVAGKLIRRLEWWSSESQKRGFSVDSNPSPGNKKGGLTTIYEKSLGAVAKAGSTPLNGVYEYGELIDHRGLVFMDTPGYDAASVTGQLSGGCNMILFTTGRGSVFGSTIAPCIKIATNSQLFERMEDDMDFNAGSLLERGGWEHTSQELLDLLVAVASGKRTQSETNGLSESEFVPWQPDATL